MYLLYDRHNSFYFNFQIHSLLNEHYYFPERKSRLQLKLESKSKHEVLCSAIPLIVPLVSMI